MEKISVDSGEVLKLHKMFLKSVKIPRRIEKFRSFEKVSEKSQSFQEVMEESKSFQKNPKKSRTSSQLTKPLHKTNKLLTKFPHLPRPSTTAEENPK
jgi:hypothetical protein